MKTKLHNQFCKRKRQIGIYDHLLFNNTLLLDRKTGILIADDYDRWFLDLHIEKNELIKRFVIGTSCDRLTLCWEEIE